MWLILSTPDHHHGSIHLLKALFYLFLLFFQDCRNQLYESYYLNFISAISRHRLEDLATAALQSNSVTQITKVHQTAICNLFKLIPWF